jgi:hypothetical protein
MLMAESYTKLLVVTTLKCSYVVKLDIIFAHPETYMHIGTPNNNFLSFSAYFSIWFICVGYSAIPNTCYKNEN